MTPSKGYCPLLFKYCSGCEQVRPAGEFKWRRKATVKGTVNRLRSRCVDCHHVEEVKRWAKMTEEQRDTRYATHREYMAKPAGQALTRKYELNRDRMEYGLRKRYGISLADYKRILADQQGVCKICQRPARGNARASSRLVVDHCHTTGRIRGLLCSACNAAMGLFGDDPIRLERAVRYVLGHNLPITPVVLALITQRPQPRQMRLLEPRFP